ncbi:MULTISPECIES: DUF2516 family protein [Corynebacterium]|uniref:DUF2516 family protein n=1 Tax=Corynebacterium coyleae TaxID=53374 RepID=A0AAP7CD52_9CORY|nr:DUF2516 family protein [Corynebacterium coyleae]PLA27298.1 DUF2516 domain-containing protein [Corynebacterium coyleae]QXB19560.1 DUF2516 family protein [Corynebacterium coyleae]WJY78848.1 hypothetical protein CCOY_01100 [Corynebacterium coyleae]SEB59415.1 Protein of unknown function [Corynebacterium coyleae]
MDTAALEQIQFITTLPSRASFLMLFAVGIAGLVAAGLVATTRPDAFEAAGRQSKGAWIGILALSAVACMLGLPFIAWFGAVAIGIYYFDIRPQIKNILEGNGGW